MTIWFHDMACISAQRSFPESALGELVLSRSAQLRVIEPKYEGIPAGLLRRMGKAVRTGVGAGLRALHGKPQPDGIVIGTANGGLEDSIKFLNQIIEYKEGLLTPANFVQSTANAVGSTISLITRNKGYSATHVHRGLAFENALLDAKMLLAENPHGQYLVGGLDEISEYNYHLDVVSGWFRPDDRNNTQLYEPGAITSLAGEGAMMAIVNANPEGAILGLSALALLHSTDPGSVTAWFRKFLDQNPHEDKTIDLLLSGEEGDTRNQTFYNGIESQISPRAIARFKHMSGEYPTAASFGLWFAGRLFAGDPLPAHALKSGSLTAAPRSVLLYNHFRGAQHALYLLRKP